MSLSTHIRVWCDNCGTCEQGSMHEGARAVRRRLKAQGWKRTKQEDFCATCVAKGAHTDQVAWRQRQHRGDTP